MAVVGLDNAVGAAAAAGEVELWVGGCAGSGDSARLRLCEGSGGVAGSPSAARCVGGTTGASEGGCTDRITVAGGGGRQAAGSEEAEGGGGAMEASGGVDSMTSLSAAERARSVLAPPLALGGGTETTAEAEAALEGAALRLAGAEMGGAEFGGSVAGGRWFWLEGGSSSLSGTRTSAAAAGGEGESGSQMTFGPKAGGRAEAAAVPLRTNSAAERCGCGCGTTEAAAAAAAAAAAIALELEVERVRATGDSDEEDEEDEDEEDEEVEEAEEAEEEAEEAEAAPEADGKGVEAAVAEGLVLAVALVEGGVVVAAAEFGFGVGGNRAFNSRNRLTTHAHIHT